MPFSLTSLPFLALLLLCVGAFPPEALIGGDVSASGGFTEPPLVRREDRRSLVVTEYGEVSAVEISTGTRGPYHLQFFTLEPNSLFLPVLLHADMVFYVHTGSGKLSWAEDGKEMRRVNLRMGDVFRLQPGSVFFFQSDLDQDREKLRIFAIFSNAEEDIYEPSIGAYSSINDLVLGFDRKLLQSAFKAPEEVIEELTSARRPPAIVHSAPAKKSIFWELEARLMEALEDGGDGDGSLSSKHKKNKAFNILNAKPDFKNHNGWSLTVDNGDMKSLKGSNIGVFMVNLTRGSTMAPHWNPMATEIAVALYGPGMIRVVCPSTANETECKNMRFRVNEGDVFAVPRLHPMAQMSFNNDSFVFMGFSTTTKKNRPQFLVGKRSVLQSMDKEILAMSFNVTNTTVIDQLLVAQLEAIILECSSCAEKEESIMEEELERKGGEEEAKKSEEVREREEKAKKREEEEAEREEEEAARKRETKKEREKEEAKKKEEQTKRREEKAEKEQDETRKQEKERQKKWKKQEEEAQRREEKEQKQEEEREKREMEEEEASRAKAKEQQKRQRHQEERRQEERRSRQEERQRKQEETRRQAEEKQRRRQQEPEEYEETALEYGKEERLQKERRRHQEERQREQEKAKKQAEERWRRRQQEPREQEKTKEEYKEEERRQEKGQREQEEARRQAEERPRRRRQEPREWEESEDEHEEREYRGGGAGRRVLRKA